MSKLDDLINKLCPNGVEFKTILETLRQPITDGPHETPKLKERGIPFVSVEAIHNGIVDVAKCRGFIDQDYSEQCRKKYKPETDDVYMVKSASIGKLAIVKDNTNFDIWSPIAAMKPNKKVIQPKFLFYCLNTDTIQKEVIKQSSKGSQPNLSMRKLEMFEIPVPPLEVQNEIVRILDKFTSLEAELEAELEARRKQYEYYRDSLLTFGDDVEWKTIGEIATINRGVRVTRDMLSTEGEIPVYQNALAPLGYFDKSNRKKDTTFVISAGAAGQIGYSGIDFWAADDCFTFDETKDVISKYIFYYLQTKQNFIDSRVRRGSIPRISRDVFAKLSIPIPSIKEQERIVSILDRFEFLCNDITSGLPAEIEARHKQYEYYRDKLLTFKRKEA